MSYSYQRLFNEAQERTESLGLSIQGDKLTFTNGRLLSLFKIFRIKFHLKKLFKNRTLESLKGQCIDLHSSIHMYINRLISNEAIFTIGYIKTDSSEYFKFSESDVTDWLTNGPEKQELKLHAWLTLPSGEIIDASFLHTYAAMNNRPIKTHEYLAGHPERFNGMKYIPMVIGYGLLHALAKKHITNYSSSFRP